MPPRKGNAAFTLVEMLVSVAVLVLLMALILELFNGASATATMSRKHITADEAARLVFDRIGNDFARMVKRPDVNYIFYKQANVGTTHVGNDQMFFYSEGPGYLDTSATSTMTVTGGASTVALVGYRINQNNPYYTANTPVLERLGESLTWTGAPDTTGTYPGGMVFLPSTLAGNWTIPLAGPPPYAQNTEHYQVLSDMVFRMEICFLLKSGTYTLPGTTVVTGTTGYSNAPTAIPSASSVTTGIPTTGNYFSGTGGTLPDYAGNVYGFPPDLAAIVVTIAVLDNGSRKLVTNTNLIALASALDDSPPASNTVGQVQTTPPAHLWQGHLTTSGFAQTVGIPQTALAQVRVYERTFYLDAN